MNKLVRSSILLLVINMIISQSPIYGQDDYQLENAPAELIEQSIIDSEDEYIDANDQDQIIENGSTKYFTPPFTKQED